MQIPKALAVQSGPAVGRAALPPTEQVRVALGAGCLGGARPTSCHAVQVSVTLSHAVQISAAASQVAVAASQVSVAAGQMSLAVGHAVQVGATVAL